MKHKWLKRKARKLAADGTPYSEAKEQLRQMFVQPAGAPDLAHRLIALSPKDDWIAIALKTQLRVRGRCGSLHHVEQQCHEQNITVLEVSPNGKWLLTAADDKVVKLWDTSKWECTKQCTMPKKVSAGCFSEDSRYMVVGDKFGDVSVASVEGEESLCPLLGHFCAIITALQVDATGRWLASGDRDGKLRISSFPEDPCKGSWEVGTYCLGHASCVTCATFSTVAGSYVLLSGGADGRLLVWDYTSGQIVCSMQMTSTHGPARPRAKSAVASEPAAEMGLCTDAAAAGTAADDINDGEACLVDQNSSPAIVSLTVDEQRGLVAVATEGDDEVSVLRLLQSSAGFDMDVAGSYALPGLTLPSRLRFDRAGMLWATGGPCMEGSSSFHLACCSLADDGSSCTAEALPKAYADLYHRVPEEDEAATKNTLTQLHGELRKKTYSSEEVEIRKANRNDKKSLLDALA